MNFKDISSYDFERRTDTAADAVCPVEATIWSDLDRSPWHLAIEKVVALAAPLREELLNKQTLASGLEDLRDLMFMSISKLKT